MNLPDVKNIFLYIDDAVRHDTAVQRLSELGLVQKTIAASVHTPASFASIYTGQHVPTHGLKAFGERYTAAHPTVFEIQDCEVTMSENRVSAPAIYNLYSSVKTAELPDLEPPFVHLYWAPGGHAPYGGFTYPDCDFEDISGQEYFDRHAGDTERLKSDYRRGVAESIEHFQELVSEVYDRYDAAETLCIYTSDHGELLGEYGLIGHNHVLVPELVNVPTLFRHPSIDPGTTNEFLRHVDILPTILEAVSSSLNYSGPGSPLNDDQIPGYSHFEKVFYDSVMMNLNWETTGVWDFDGGHVFTEASWIDSLAIYVGMVVNSAKGRHIRSTGRYRDALPHYTPGHRQYGNPGFSVDDAREIISTVDSETTESNRELSSDQIDHLKDLGYR